MENNFIKIMAEHSDEKLIDILKGRNNYQPIAVDAAVKESINRKIIIDSNDLEVKYPMSSIISVQNEIHEQEYINAKKKQAENDMLYGALWCFMVHRWNYCNGSSYWFYFLGRNFVWWDTVF